MTSDILLGVGGLLAGLGSGGLGLYMYVGRRAPALYQQTNMNTGGLFGRAVVAFLTPAGLAFTLMGIAFIVGKNAVTTDLLLAALAFIALAWLVFFVHPRWILPTWLRSDNHDRRRQRS